MKCLEYYVEAPFPYMNRHTPLGYICGSAAFRSIVDLTPETSQVGLMQYITLHYMADRNVAHHGGVGTIFH